MTLAICFHYDEKFRDLWDQITRTYGIKVIYEIETPKDLDPGPWIPIESLDEIDIKPLIFFSSIDAKYHPGEISLRDFKHPKDALYYFGSDYANNTAKHCDGCVYVPTPKRRALWSMQAASIVLDDWWKYHGDH